LRKKSCRDSQEYISSFSDRKYNPDVKQTYENYLNEAQAFLQEKNIPCRTLLSVRDIDTYAGEDLIQISQKEQVDEIVVSNSR
jgi:hypothetical protein